MGLVSTLLVEEELEDAHAREKAEVSAVDYNRKANGPYKTGVQRVAIVVCLTIYT